MIFWHEFTILPFILCVTKPCGYRLLLSLGRIHSLVDCPQKFKAYPKSHLNLLLQWVRFCLALGTGVGRSVFC